MSSKKPSAPVRKPDDSDECECGHIREEHAEGNCAARHDYEYSRCSCPSFRLQR